MADVTATVNQDHERPASPASSTSSSSSNKPERNHDWIAGQMQLRKQEYVETLGITVKIVSWNVNGKRVAEDITDLLLEDVEPGIYAIGYPPSSRMTINVTDFRKWIWEREHMSSMIQLMNWNGQARYPPS